MATSNDILISVQHLVKEYDHGAVHALNDCDLDIRRGEVVAIIGPSGSGKSTLLRSLNLLEQPTSGAIFFDGADLAGKSVNIDLHRQKMGMVFQHFNLFPHKTVLQNITMAPVTLKKKTPAEAKAQAMALLERIGLADKAFDMMPVLLQRALETIESCPCANGCPSCIGTPSENGKRDAVVLIRRLLDEQFAGTT